GRAVFWPVISGQYERRYIQPPGSAAESRDRRIRPVLDMLRSVDYLASRSDILRNGIAFEGTSAGARMGVFVVALEPRLRAAVLLDGGLPTGPSLGPEVDAS